MQDSNTTISTSFFDNLWPLILEENKCDIKTSNTSEFFVPERKFDDLWAHTVLASKHYGNYAKPTELICKQTDNESENNKIQCDEEIEQQPYCSEATSILPLDQQLATIQRDVEIREQLAYDFVNRKFPWYIQRPSYEQNFTITEQMKSEFRDPFEYEILYNIQLFECNVMIIDVATFVDLKYFERWQKFAPYVALITVVHDHDVYRQIRNYNKIFLSVEMEENLESTWQDELNRSMKLGVKCARNSYLLEDDSKAFVFVFSNNRGICICDKFKVLRKF